MKRIFTALVIAAFAFNAHAGFLTGVVVGHMATSKKTVNYEQGTVLQSDVPGHDVLTCRKDSTDPRYCRTFYVGNDLKVLTPAQYAYFMGYKTIHKVGAVLQDGYEYYIMEVSK